jgi:hypothetical protein
MTTEKQKEYAKRQNERFKLLKVRRELASQLDDLKTREYRSYGEVIEMLLESYKKGK